MRLMMPTFQILLSSILAKRLYLRTPRHFTGERYQNQMEVLGG
jgi:hypothetical protein